MTKGSLDQALVRRHLIALDEALINLRRHSGIDLEVLEKDRDLRWTIERGLQLCAQNVLDVATHIVASAGHDAGDYASAIDSLGRIGVLPAAFVARFRGVAGFRNVLVHAYLSVDLVLVHELLTRRLDDFAEFARCVELYLSE